MADHIQIGDISPRIQYSGDGVQTAFTYPFPIFSEVDIQAYVDGILAVLTTDYTVAGAGNSAGGTVIFLIAPATGAVVTLRRNMALARTSDFQESGEFRAKVINDELDILTALLQQVDEQSDRTLRLSPTDSAGTTVLPDKAIRAGNYLAFDADGDPIASTGSVDALAVSTFIATLLGDTDATAARSTLGAVIGTDVLAPTGDGSALTGITTGATEVERANIALNAFRIAVNGGLSVQNMVDGIVDEFEDESGVDSATSSNQTYDATDDYYHNPGTTTTPSATGEFTGDNSDFTFSGSDLTGYADQALKGVDTFTGEVDVDFTLGTGGASTYGHIGLYDTTEDATWVSTADAGMGSMTNCFRLGNNNGTWTVYLGGTSKTTFAATTNQVIKIERDASNNIKVWADSVLKYTFASTFSGALRMAIGGHPSQDYNGLTWTAPGTASDMTLQSNAATALAEPTSAFIVLWHETVDSITLNTDIKGWISRDGGTTWTQATLVLVANLTGNEQILTGSADISAQPAGTSVKWKVETLNNKEQRIRGVSEQWS